MFLFLYRRIGVSTDMLKAIFCLDFRRQGTRELKWCMIVRNIHDKDGIEFLLLDEIFCIFGLDFIHRRLLVTLLYLDFTQLALRNSEVETRVDIIS